MTVGMMMESITGKAAAIRGKKVDASAFVVRDGGCKGCNERRRVRVFW